MVRGSMLRWGWLVAGVAVTLTGCTCGQQQVDCADTTLTFATPTAGQALDSPFDVSFSVKGPDGAAFSIDGATLKVGEQTLDGTVSGNRATFSGVTAAPGEVTLTPTIAQGSCSKTGEPITITVRDACATPQVRTVQFPQDMAPLGVLNLIDLPAGAFVKVKVTASCVTADTQVRILRGTSVVGPLTSFVNGEATITTTLPDADEARYDLFAELVRNGQPLNTLAGNPAAAGSIVVNRSLPTCAVVTSGTFGPMDDQDLTAPGYQVRVTGTMAPGSSGTIAVDSQTPVTVVAATNGTVSADFTVASTGDTTYLVGMLCTSAAGNVETAEGSFRVDLQAPTVSITAPASADGGTVKVARSPTAFVVATDAEDGSLAAVSVNGTAQGTDTVTGGAASLPVSFGADGLYTVTVRVTDTAGNVTSKSLVVEVTLDGCGAVFSQPGSCPALLTSAQLVGGSYVFQSTSKASCVGQPAKLFRADALADGGVGADALAASTTLGDGGTAVFPAVAVTSGDYVFKAAVTSLDPDAGVSEASCQVTVDLEGPAITSPAQASGQPYAIVNADEDDQLAAPGVQRPVRFGGLTFSARVPAGGRVDVCTTQATDPATSLARPTSAECGTGYFVLLQGAVSPVDQFTFPDGQYSLKVVVVGGGVTSASAPLPILSDSVRPCLTARVLPQDGTGDGRLNIAELDGGQPLLAFTLGCGDTSPADLAASNPVVVRDVVAGAPSAARASTAAFASGGYRVSVPVPAATEADLALFVELTDLAGNKNVFQTTGDPSSYAFRVDQVAPSISITSPSNPDGGTTVAVTQSPTTFVVATNAEDGSPVAVSRNGVVQGSATVTAGAASVPVSFGAEGTFTIAARVTDSAGNASTASLTADVTLDGCGAAFTRPGACPALITPAQLSGGSYVFQSSSKASCVGQAATLFRTDVQSDGGVLPEVSAATTTLTAAGAATYPAVTLPSGQYVFRSAVANIGGDAGISETTCQVTVDLDGPVITSPIKPTNQPYAIVNANQDDLPNVPGVQRPARLGGLTFSALVPTGGRVDVCTTQATNPVTSQPRSTTPECGAGYFLLFQDAVSPVDLFTFPDGQYDIKVVVVGGGLATAPASPPLPILSDSVRPCLTARTLPQDSNLDGRLNIAELDGGQPQLAFTLGCGDTTTTTLATSNPVVVKDIVGVPGTSRAATPVFSNGGYVVTVPVTAGTEADLALFVELTDSAGNKNQFQVSADPSSYAFRVDQVAPSCSIVTPSAAQTLVGLAGAPGGQFSTQVSTSNDVGVNGVRVGFGGTTREVTPVNGSAQTDFAVSGTQSYTMSATCTDASGNSTVASSRTLTIDLDRPTCSITAPTAGAYNTNRVLTTVAVTGADGQSVTIRSDAQAAPVTTSLVVTSGTASATLQYPKALGQTISADVSDAAGNACVTASVTGIDITSDACLLQLSNVVVNSFGSWKNRSATSNLTSLTATTGSMSGVIANSADCRSGERVTLQRVAPTSGTLVELVTASNGDVVLGTPLTVTDGETWTVTAYSPASTTSTADFRVGLAVPSATGVTINGFQPAAGQPIYFVATDDNFNLDTANGTPQSTRYFADQAAATSGAQVSLDVTATSGMVYGASDRGTVDVLFTPVTGSVLTSQVATAGASLGSTTITLPHNTTGTFTVRLTSASGNTADFYASTAAVDVIAPAEPTLSPLTLLDHRAATVDVTWTTVYDDGSDSSSGSLDLSGSPTTKGYDLRWTTGSVYNNAQLGTEAAFYSSSNVSSIVAGPTQLQLPPLNTYYVVVRARDEVGNYSRFVPASDATGVTKTQSLVNMWDGGVQLTVTGTTTDFGTTIATEGSVVGDDISDVVISAPGRGNAGSVYVFTGRSPFNGFSGACAASTDGGVNCQEIVAPDGVGTLFGGDVSTGGNLTDVPSEVGVSDLVVGQRGYSTTGRVFIFPGTRTAALTTSTFVEIRGDAANTGIGQTARIVGDLDGDGYAELAISAFNYGSFRGRIYIFKGRSFTAWPASPVAITSADWVIEAEQILPADPVSTANTLGLARLGLISTPGYTGRLGADGGAAPELVIPLARTSLSKVVLYGNDRLAASSVSAPLGVLDGGIQTISRTPSGTSPNTSNYLGFGVAALAGSVLSQRDLIVSNPTAAQVQFFSNWSSTGVANGVESFTISGPTTFGALVASGDLGAGAEPDLVVGEAVTTNTGAWVLFQRSASFPSAIGGTNVRFWISEFRTGGGVGVGVRSPQVTFSGVVIQAKQIALADVDGSGGVDLLIAEATGPSVRVWR